MTIRLCFFAMSLTKDMTFERCGRVQTRRRLVKEEKLRAGDKLSRDTNTTLLTTRDALPDGCADEVVCLALKAEGGQESLDTLNALQLADRPWQRQARSEGQCLANGERTDQRIFLLNICGDSAERLGVGC